MQQDMALLDRDTLDIVTSPTSIHIGDEGTLHIDGRESAFKLAPSASKQLTQHFDIPHRYFICCPSHLQAANLNHWFARSSDSRWALRISNAKVLGFNFMGEIPFGRKQLVDLLTHMEIEHPFETLSYNLHTDSLDMRLFIPGEQHSVGTLGNGAPDLVCPGLHLQCCEVGSPVLTIHGLVHRLVCENGLLPPSREVFFRHYTSTYDDDLVDRLKQDLYLALMVADESIRRMRIATHKKIKDPIGFIVAQATQRFTKDFAREAIHAYSREGAEPTLYCVINAFTRAAQIYPVQERLRIESFAGELLAS
jgi:hypothetical protein